MIKKLILKNLDLIIKELKNNKDIKLSYQKSKNLLIIRRVENKKIN